VAPLIGRLSGRRATIVDSRGRVLGESASPTVAAASPPDYRTRPEIREAIELGRGRAIRRSATLHMDHLYVAGMSERGEVLRLGMPLSEVDEALAGVQRAILIAGSVGVLVAAFFSFGFSLLVTRPLRRMSEVARAMSAGDLSRRLRVQREDELGDLANALNTLTDELKRRLSQLEGERAEMQALIDSMSEGVLAFSRSGMLRRANPAARRLFALTGRAEGIPPEMVSRRPEFLRLVSLALEGNTIEPREISGEGRSLLVTGHPLPDGGAVLVFLDTSELRRLEGVRRDFVANASHELKTPLTAIRGYSETLLDPDLPPDLVRRFSEVIRSNSDRLQRIIDDLLDLSRIESGQWSVQSRQVDVESAAREAWSQLAAGGGPQVTMVTDIESERGFVWADPAALHQIFTNLFSNSIRYTPAGGTITVRTGSVSGRGNLMRRTSAVQADGWTAIEVEDTGSGIQPAHLERIFERFYRADPARSREEGGTGLGLAIVKNLVEAHGGSIEAESEVGRGTTIRFALPSRPSASAAA
jgi:two-component system, OmpR family, phosphate regulon sensor histidine kinase PhoR